MKLTKSLVKKGGKKSLKKTLKMRKSKKGGKKSLKSRKIRKTMKGGKTWNELEKITKGELAAQYKEVYDYYHSDRTPEEKTNAVEYVNCFLQPRVISAKDTIDNVSADQGWGQSEVLSNFVVKPEFVGVEGNPAVSMGNSLSIINVLDDLKITDDPGSMTFTKTRYKLYSTYETGEAYPPKWNPEQKYGPSDSGCPYDKDEISGGKKSLKNRKMRKSRKMKGGTVYDCSDEYQDDETKANRINLVTKRASNDGQGVKEQENMVKVRKEGNYDKTAIYYKKALIPGRGKTMTCYVPSDQETFMTPS